MGEITVKSIIEDYLREHGFDGLFNPGECSCRMDDLFLCETAQTDCMPGYLMPCPGGDECDCEDMHIGMKKMQVTQMKQPRTCEHCDHAHGTPMASTDMITCNIVGRRYPAICYCGLYRRRKDEIA